MVDFRKKELIKITNVMKNTLLLFRPRGSIRLLSFQLLSPRKQQCTGI